jgi:hypothetical protein
MSQRRKGSRIQANTIASAATLSHQRRFAGCCSVACGKNGRAGTATFCGEGGLKVGAYTIRYRSTKALGTPALVVEDPEGSAYLFTAQMLQVRASGAQACERLIRLLGGRDSWEEVPRVSPYSLDALRCLLGGGKSVQGGVSPC